MFSRNITLLFLLAIFVGIALSARPWDGDNDFAAFKEKHGRRYKNDVEHGKRYKIFKKNKDLVSNRNNNKTGQTFKLSLNRFSDYTPDELGKIHGLEIPNNALTRMNFRKGQRQPKRAAKITTTKATSLAGNLPASVDWRTSGAVMPPRDQGMCGSCWAHAVTGAIESHMQIKSGVPISLSPQNLVDCSPNDPYYTFGCDGGWPIGAFMYIAEAGGVNAEISYPYTSQNGQSSGCVVNTNTKFGALQSPGYTYVPGNNETAILEALQKGPVVATIYSSLPSFYQYSSGVYLDMDCPADQVDHAVLIIGYGTDSTTNLPYYLIKNSWGTGWGENGYVRLARVGNTCSILKNGVSYPTLK